MFPLLPASIQNKPPTKAPSIRQRSSTYPIQLHAISVTCFLSRRVLCRMRQARFMLPDRRPYATLDLLDGFDIRSPVSGELALRVSADAVRSIDTETTRYPVKFGKATGGVEAFYTGMGDNKLRLNATDFFPSFRENNGLRFDKFVPRFTFSGPIVRNRAWFFDGVELEYDNIYIQELPSNADTNHLAPRQQPGESPGKPYSREHPYGRTPL